MADDTQLTYIARKIAHMQRIGIPAGIGQHGGACPKWLTEQRETDEKRRARRKSSRAAVAA